MPAILLHLTYDETRVGEDYAKMTLCFIERPVDEIRETAHRLLAAGDYWAVGEFASSDPDTVWGLAQNLGERSPSWSRLPPEGVKPLGDGTVFGGLGYRSSMVGDIVVVDGRCHVVAGVGFQDLGPLPEGVTIETLPRPKDTGPRERHSAAPVRPFKPVPEVPDGDDQPELVIHEDPAVLGVAFEGDTLVVTFDNGRGLIEGEEKAEVALRIPVGSVPWLAAATVAQRRNYAVSPFGVAWLWPLKESLRAGELIRLAEEARPPAPGPR